MKKLLFLTISCIVFVQQATLAMYPLHDAVRAGDKAQVAALLNSGMDVNLQIKYDGETPLYAAAERAYGAKAIVLLLLEHNANPNLADNNGRTPLLLAAGNGYETVVRLLLEHNANPNLADNNGSTPLHEAAKEGNEAFARLLLEHGANANQPTNDGWTPLRTAAFFGHEAVVRLLQAWPIMQHQAHTAQLAFCGSLHQRVGARSQARVLNPYLIHEILQYVQPADFPAIPAVVAPVIPAHATPAPTLSQQAWKTAQNILSDPRVQIAAAAVTALSFVAWRLLHH